MDLLNAVDELDSLDDAKRLILELNARHQSELEALHAAIAELQQKKGLSSRNSAKAPSTDSPAQRYQRKKQTRSTRRKGAQPGHQKHERVLLPEDQVDCVQRYFPQARCQCGGTLVMNPQPTYRHQVFDLPKVRYQVSEHQLYSGVCPACQQKQTAKAPASVPSGQMGGGLISTILQLSGQFHLSIRQIQRYLSDVWSLAFSAGAISQAQGKANPWLGVVYRQIAEAVRSSPVAHADETRHYRGTELRWLWTLSTPDLCFFLVHHSRGKGAAAELLGDFKGYLVTDHYSAYRVVDNNARQLCWAHLIRHFIGISERKGLAGHLGKRLLLISHAIVRTRHRQQQNTDQFMRYDARLRRLRKSFRAALESGTQLKLADRTRRQCQHLLKDEDLCWTFLKSPAIPLTNNLAERAIRPYVIWRKLSFSSQSYQGDQFRPVILSIIGSAQKLGLNVSSLLRNLCDAGLRGEPVTTRLPLQKALPSSA